MCTQCKELVLTDKSVIGYKVFRKADDHRLLNLFNTGIPQTYSRTGLNCAKSEQHGISAFDSLVIAAALAESCNDRHECAWNVPRLACGALIGRAVVWKVRLRPEGLTKGVWDSCINYFDGKRVRWLSHPAVYEARTIELIDQVS